MRTEETISVNANSIIGRGSAGFLLPEVLPRFAFRINRDYAKKVDLIYVPPVAQDRERGRTSVRVRGVILRCFFKLWNEVALPPFFFARGNGLN